MKTARQIGVAVILQVFATQVIQSSKVWLPRVDFMDTANWIPMMLPSSEQTIVFPSRLNALVGLPEGILTVSGLILPQQGGLLFPGHSFSLNVVSQEPSSISVAIFKAPGRTPYYSGANWASYDEQRSSRQAPNAAVPHSERVPCQYETVIFETGNSLPKPIDLQYHESIEVSNVRLGETIEGLENFRNFILSELGQYLFYNAEDTLIRQGKCISAEKCPCQEPRQMDAICSNERCTAPHCLSPIQPPGHCCPICGSLFRMNMASFQGVFNLQSFTDKLHRKFDSADVNEADVVYHIGIDRLQGANVLQLIIIDKGEYGEKSIRMMNSLRPFFEKQFASGFYITHAGQPYTPLEGDQVLAFVLLTLIINSAFFTVLYVYYYDNTFLPRLRAAVRNRQFFTTPFVFARFQPNSDADRLSVDVNFPIERQLPAEECDQTVSLESVDNHLVSSFNNPMYEKSPQTSKPAPELFNDVELHAK
ncbi:protein amnionless [Anopheles maculipalpis]|uniref:protein amnionless n=1 Tax=Anopheles maculipalpis TaxID=1496333 RepID=UPI00215940D6|nr:protein amnionless [Anopheles maculipalpis]